MARPLRFHPRLPVDLREAVNWYEAKSAGLANRFRAAVNRGFDEVENYPNLYPRAGDTSIRFRHVGKFPYLLLYRVNSGVPEILRLVHSASDPANWLSGLEDA